MFSRVPALWPEIIRQREKPFNVSCPSTTPKWSVQLVDSAGRRTPADPLQPPKKVRTENAPAVSLGPQVQEGELVFGVAHIYAS